MIEEWKIYKCKKDKNHPYASVWEISSYGRVKRDGVIIEPIYMENKKPRVVINGCIRRIIKNV